MSKTVIKVENLSKYYRLGLIGGGTLREDVNRAIAKLLGRPDPLLKIGEKDHGNRKGGQIWALRDLNFEVKEGEILGVIGGNGAGKSTLLKILSRITAPTEGSVKIKGRVGSLLEVGTGFHPELTGRENIYLNGTILGMQRAEVTSKLEEIIEFAEMSKFIDTPVKRYSSGMTVRLAFAVAAHLEPEILIVDEVLAVGDDAFQKKCLGKMKDVASGGRTVLFVSHNMNTIAKLCSRAIWMSKGSLEFDGPTEATIANYLCSATSNGAQIDWGEGISNPAVEEFKLKRIAITNSNSVVTNNLQTSEIFRIELEYQIFKLIKNMRIVLQITSMDGSILFETYDIEMPTANRIHEENIYHAAAQIPRSLLLEGQYFISVNIGVPREKKFLFLENVLSFHVSEVGGSTSDLIRNRKGYISPAIKWTRNLSSLGEAKI